MGRMSLKAGPLTRMNSCLIYHPEGTRLLRRTATFSLAVSIIGHVLGRTVMIQREVFLMTSMDREGCCRDLFQVVSVLPTCLNGSWKLTLILNVKP
jgi:hypothetical protein